MKSVQGVFIRYLSRLFIIRFLALLSFFVIVLQMLDLLNESEKILKVEGAGWPSMVDYVILRAPQIISQFTPFAALLAIVLTLAILNHTSEITVMRAAGMSVQRVILPIGVVCGVVAAAHFTFHEIVVVKAAEKLDYWEANDYALNLPPDGGARTNLRLNHEGDFVSAGSAARIGSAVFLNDVTIYSRDDKGLVEEITEARAARYENREWRLYGIRRLDAQNQSITEETSALWPTKLDPDFLFALTLKPDRTMLGELWRKIQQLREDNADTRAAMTSLLGRFSKPLSTLVMPLLGAIAGFGVHRQGVLLARAVTGSALGFGYFVAENLSLAVGKLGAVPAVVGAFFPFALFIVVGFSILLAMEN
ncbi:MAG: LPS export ABC transporter permease LptG [Parvularculaceae bacterium]